MTSRPASAHDRLLRAALIALQLTTLIGFALPWVVGDFGTRTSLSGIVLAGVSQSIDGWAWRGASSVVLFACPVFAVDGLLVALAGPRFSLSPRAMYSSMTGLALPIALLSGGTLVLVWRAAGDQGLVQGAGMGLYLACAASITTTVVAFDARRRVA